MYFQDGGRLPCWILEKVGFWLQWPSYGQSLSAYQIWRNYLCQWPRYGRKSKFKMAACEQFDFGSHWPSYVQFLSPYQIWCKSVKKWPRYTCLCIFKMAAVRHLGFAIIPFWSTHDVPFIGYIFPGDGVIIRSDVTEILRFYNFADLDWKSLFPPILGNFYPLKLWRHYFNP